MLISPPRPGAPRPRSGRAPAGRITRCGALASCAWLALHSCTCGPDASPGTDAPAPAIADDGIPWQRQAFEALLAGLPPAKVAQPARALPSGYAWQLSSDDAAGWFDAASQRESVRALAQSPLSQELRTTGPWLAMDSMRHHIARASAFAGGAEDARALWQGPVAVALRDLEDERPDFIVVKRIEPGLQAVVRFAAAFGQVALSQGASAPGRAGDATPGGADDSGPRATVASREVAGVTLRKVTWREESVSFALFRDLLVLGSRDDKVEEALLRAAGEAEASPADEGRRPAPDVWAPPGHPGLHVLWLPAPGGSFHDLGVDALSATFTHTADAPLGLRLHGDLGEAQAPSPLLRYIPAGVYAAMVDARPPADLGWPRIRARLLAAAGTSRQAAALAERIESRLLPLLLPGTALWVGPTPGARADDASLGAVIAFRHQDKARVEVEARALLAALTEARAERSVLESQGGAWLLTTRNEGPAAALSDDALLLALSPAPLRAALAAGAGQARSLRDLGAPAAPASQGIFVDFAQGALGLREVYRDAFAEGSPAAPQVMETLAPTFDAIARAGRFVAWLAPEAPRTNGGAFHALP